jgi:ATP adenylyltransferase
VRSKNDKKNLLVYRSKKSFVLLNAYPYNNGHLMIITNRHTGSLESLKPAELSDMLALTKRMVSLLTRTLKPDGFNIGLNLGTFAGAGIARHIHVHIVPRWAGDTNFMPVLAGTKIISQSLQELYRLLTKQQQKKTS